MLEWLGGDPLNGIAVTVTFFISLIIGRYIGLWRKRSPKLNKITVKQND